MTRLQAALVVAICGLACTPSANETIGAGVAGITRQRIEHVAPKRDFVGAAPLKLEWTAADGVDSYTVTVMNEVDAVLLDYKGAHGTSIDWPKEVGLESGTYFWRVVGVRDGRPVADSGRAAFVVRE
jgi:hypothetical protein